MRAPKQIINTYHFARFDKCPAIVNNFIVPWNIYVLTLIVIIRVDPFTLSKSLLGKGHTTRDTTLKVDL